jgi:peroxiredoxin Q/BCP
MAKKPTSQATGATTSKTPRTATAKTAGTPKTASKTASKTAVRKAPHDLAVAQPAPAFQLPRDGGGQVTLADFAGQKLVIFFYPRADTPGCTREAIAFSRLANDFTASGTALLGVSADPPKAQEAFRDKHALTVPLGSDLTHAMLKHYGVWGNKTMYGKSFEGIIRTTVLIDEGGRVARIWRNVKVDGHAEEVLAAARALPDQP